MRLAALAVATLALVSCGEVRDTFVVPYMLVSADDGFGGIRIGMTLEEAEAANGSPLILDDALDDPFACRTFRLYEGNDMYLMARQNRVSRVSVEGSHPRPRTPEGIEVGSTSEQVRAAYPNAIEQDPAYDERPAHDLIVWTVPETRGYRFEIGQDGVVRALHAGDDSVLLLEGCA